MIWQKEKYTVSLLSPETRMEPPCPPQYLPSIYPSLRGMESISKVGKNKHRLETIKIFKFKLLWIFIKFSNIWKHFRIFFGADVLWLRVEEKLKYFEIFSHRHIKIFENICRSDLATSPPTAGDPLGHLAQVRLEPASHFPPWGSDQVQVRKLYRVQRTERFSSSEFHSICLILFEFDLQIVWLTEVNRICDQKQADNCRLFYFHIQFSWIVFLL